jgi:hypothetical protein
MKYPRKENCSKRAVYFRRKEQPSVRRALPPVGWHRTVVHPWQMTTVWACEKTVVMVKQPGHLTSMKKERGGGHKGLELVLLGLSGWRRVQEINGENLCQKASVMRS